MTNDELQRLTETISLQFFSRPFIHQAYFKFRLRTTGGRYLLRTHHIEVNPKFYQFFGETEIINIIKHELCHYHLHLAGKGYRHRDRDFKQLSTQVNAPRYCKSLPEENKRNTTIYIYQCMDCRQAYHRKRKMNTDKYVCGKCRGKIFLLKKD